MYRLTIKSILANKVRFALTSVAVMLGVAFLAGTLVLTDTLKQGYDEAAGGVYATTDAVVRVKGHVQGTSDAAEVRGTVDAALLERVRATDGVAVAEPQQVGIAAVVGHDGRLVDANPNRSTPLALGWQDTPAFNPMDVVAGHAPRGADEVVVDRATQRTASFRIGETVRVVGPSGAFPYRLVGIVTYSGADSAAGAQVVAFSPETAAQVLGNAGRYSSIQVLAQDSVSQEQVAANVAAAVGDGSVEVVTGTAATADARAATGASREFVDMFLLTFAIVALVVGSFVIFNTFSITVAQRTKANALLRAIGAGRKQVTRSVMLEALLTGVFASVIGVVAGIGTAQALRWVLDAFGMSLPTTGTVVMPRTIVVAMTMGIVVTLIAVYAPARRAGRVAPLEALRSGTVGAERASKRRSVLGVLVTVAGAVMIGQALSAAEPGIVGMGALAVFVGVAMLGPAMARPFVRVLGWPVARLRGMPGVLARENASRNPRRTSATASALMIGVGMVALITVFAASARASIATTVDVSMKGDYIVDTQFGMGGLSPAVAQQLREMPEIGAVTQLRYATATVDGAAKDVTAFDPSTVEETVYTNVEHGSMTGLGAHDVAVQHDEAEAHDIYVGDTVVLSFPETGAQEMRVVAEYATKDPFGAYAVSLEAFDANVASHVDDYVVVTTAPGVSTDDTRQAIEQVLAEYPTADLLTRDEFKASMAAEIDKMLNLVYVLLAMALVIAFFGIANTLALAVFERTREFGLLRAIGMARAHVRSTVRWESVLIALLGTALGTAIGIGFSWALVRALEDQGFNQLTVPVQQLLVLVVGAAAAAVVAAALPARRAARLDVLDAIGH